MNKEMEDWVLIEAAKRCGWEDWTLRVVRAQIPDDEAFRALCDMILKHEQPPVDLVEAQAAEIEKLREAVAIMHTAFAAYADSPAKKEAIALAALGETK